MMGALQPKTYEFSGLNALLDQAHWQRRELVIWSVLFQRHRGDSAVCRADTGRSHEVGSLSGRSLREELIDKAHNTGVYSNGIVTVQQAKSSFNLLAILIL